MTHEYPEQHDNGMSLPDDLDAELAELLGAELDSDTESWIEENRKKVLEATRQHIVAQYLEFCNNDLDIGAYATVLAHERGIDTDTDVDFRPQFYAELDLIITTIDESQVGKVSADELIRRKYRLAAKLVARYGSMAARPLIDMIDIANSGGDMVSEFDADTIVATDELFTGSNAIRDERYDSALEPSYAVLFGTVQQQLPRIIGHRDDLDSCASIVTAGGIKLAQLQWEVDHVHGLSDDEITSRTNATLMSIGTHLREEFEKFGVEFEDEESPILPRVVELMQYIACRTQEILQRAFEAGDL